MVAVVVAAAVIVVVAVATGGSFENAYPRRSTRSSPGIWSLSLSVSECTVKGKVVPDHN
jgi:hypothetical protein